MIFFSLNYIKKKNLLYLKSTQFQADPKKTFSGLKPTIRAQVLLTQVLFSSETAVLHPSLELVPGKVLIAEDTIQGLGNTICEPKKLMDRHLCNKLIILFRIE